MNEELNNIILKVLSMKKFSELPVQLNKSKLIEDTYNRLIERQQNFTERTSFITGNPISKEIYLSTIAKSFIIGEVWKYKKLQKN